MKTIDELLALMTLEEKAGQLNFPHGAMELGRDSVRRGEIGGVLIGPPLWSKKDFSWREELDSLQRVAVEESRLGVPLLFSRDVIHGQRTIFPIPLGQAASFDPQLVKQCAGITAREASAEGVHWNYSPMVDIARDPRWGRIAEGYGEDAYLCSQMAEAVVSGYQGSDLSNPFSIAACAKHFAAYGLPSGGRDYDSVEMSEETLRDVYLRPFAAAVTAGAASIMAGLHDLNGLPLTAHQRLLLEVLRGEFGFRGVITSDWGAIADLLKHRVAGSEEEAVILAVEAGIECDMVSGLYLKHLPALVRNGRIKEEAVDAAVRSVLRLKESLGLFSNPYVQGDRDDLLRPEHRHAARKLAQRSIVLLQNRSALLPLPPSIGSIAVVGPFSEAKAELLGTWVLDGKAEDVVSIAEGIRSAVSSGTRVIAEAAHAEQALACAGEAEAIVAVIGEHPTRSGEAASISDVNLPPGQAEFISRLAQFGRPLVAVILAGRPLVIERICRYADAVVYLFHPGVEGGNAVADILFGKEEPSGKLPVCFPRTSGQVPVHYSRRSTGRPPDRFARYTAKYIDVPWTPLYYFGYGLSYTQFEFSKLELAPERGPGPFAVSVSVRNSGAREGTEVVQLYVRDEVRSSAPPEWELRRFERVRLQAGESREVTFTLTAADLSFWRQGAGSIAEPGVFVCRAGNSSESGLTANFTLVPPPLKC